MGLLFLSSLPCPLPVGAAAWQERKEVTGAIASRARLPAAADSEKELREAARGAGTSAQVRNAAGQTLPAEALLSGLSPPKPFWVKQV